MCSLNCSVRGRVSHRSFCTPPTVKLDTVNLISAMSHWTLLTVKSAMSKKLVLELETRLRTELFRIYFLIYSKLPQFSKVPCAVGLIAIFRFPAISRMVVNASKGYRTLPLHKAAYIDVWHRPDQQTSRWEWLC